MSQEIINNYFNVNVNPVIKIPTIQNATKLINSTQCVMANGIGIFNQPTFASETFFRITLTQKIKFEWVKTFIGKHSASVNLQENMTVNDESIGIFSFSYNVAL